MTADNARAFARLAEKMKDVKIASWQPPAVPEGTSSLWAKGLLRDQTNNVKSRFSDRALYDYLTHMNTMSANAHLRDPNVQQIRPKG